MDPVRGERIAGALGAIADLMGGSHDVTVAQQRAEERMKALGQSPAMHQFLEQQKSVLQRMKQQNPGVAQAMQRQLDEMERMANDPAGFRAELEAQAAVEATEAEESDGPEESALPPGRFLFECSDVGQPNEHQKRPFTRLVERQQELARKVEKALREMHAEVAESVDLDDPKACVLFPEDARSSNVPLDYFRIERFVLPESGDRIGLSLESIFGHEEHGCALVIEGDEVAEFGGTDLLCMLEYGEDEFDEDDLGEDEDDEA